MDQSNRRRAAYKGNPTTLNASEARSTAAPTSDRRLIAAGIKRGNGPLVIQEVAA
ncbi:hypothetical protein [Streptomyces sp. NPDC059783]|uniref:hypothetical protein n=1 Tax=Streptomyces sp. NPDC059783 TaxID=3346944 RepID=UPI00365CEB3E